MRHRAGSFLRLGLLVLAGLFVARPFLTTRGVGTGEAYNYSLAVADGVTQLRAGVFPVLAGQTPFAFNGRVHPLRNAPYLIYLAGGIDLVTGRQLGFPALQNLSLAFSLLLSFLAAYGALRWGIRCRPWPALFLAIVYGASAALLAAAYSFDLYMTVHAAPFVPLALAAAARPADAPAVRYDFALAGFLAMAWWAHPPVALWLTVTAGLLRLVLWASRPSGRSLAGLVGAGIFGGLLAGFTFLSAFEITQYASFFNAGTRAETGFVALVLSEARHAFMGSIAPVSRSADRLGDFQLGYVGWCLLGATLLRLRRPGPWLGRRLAAAGLAGIALLMVSLCVQVPYFTAWIWSRLPGVFYLLTNDWPMQRLYLIATGATVLAAGLVLAPDPFSDGRRRPWLLAGLLAVGLGWTAWEATPFIGRGQRDRWTKEGTAQSYLPSNLDLTATSYAFLGIPPTFIHGVMEPWLEFRILDHFGRDEVTSNYAAGLAQGQVAAAGTFRALPPAGSAGGLYDPPLTLEPNRHYLLDFHWRTAAFAGVMALSGPALQRVYLLPEAGEARAFGMRAGQRTALALSTSRAQPENVRLRLLAGSGATLKPPPVLADYRLIAVDEAKLPVRVHAWLPLRLSVTAPNDTCYVETARRFIPGYTATVNGRRVRAVPSPSGQLMVPVPAGDSEVAVRYSGTLPLVIAFWVSLGTGVLGLLAASAWLLGIRFRRPGRRAGWGLTAALLSAGAVTLAIERPWRRLPPVPGTEGPLEVRFLLPQGFSQRQQPLVVSGRQGAGNFVFLTYADDSHIRIGLDIWGYLRLSDPIAVDYRQEQELVVSGGMFYPPDDPFVRSLSPFQQSELRRELRVELNGRTVLVETHPPYASAPKQVTIGATTIGGSLVEPRFRGDLLEVRRLPVPLTVVRSDHPLRLEFMLPANEAGRSEPLLTTWTSRHTQELIYLTYLAGSRVALGYATTDGQEFDSPPRSARLDRIHTVDLVTRGPDLFLLLDGAEQLRVPGAGLPPEHVEIARLGINATPLAVARARFTGPRLTVGIRASHPVSPASGPYHLVALLPAGKTGVTEPLLVTGKTGRGDLVFIKYTDPNHVQIGYDHWGVGGGMSAPFAIDYTRPHEITIGLGSLFPEGSEAPGTDLSALARRRLRERVTVRIDGTEVCDWSSTAYPSDPGDILVGQNRIGASSCVEDFSGEILAASRQP